MAIEFERGDGATAKGHAVLYFENSAAPGEIWATYVIIMPIAVDVAKYLPPFLLNQVGEIGAESLSSFAFPPAPEKVSGRDYLEGLAEARGDDLLFGGSVDAADAAAGMMLVNESVRQYSALYSATEAATLPPAEEEPDAEGLSVNEVLYELMSDGDKLGELTKLVGRLRYASEGGEEALVREAERDIAALARKLPEEFEIARLVAFAKSSAPLAGRIADLCLQRCFHLAQQEFVKLGQVEREIESLQESTDAPA